MRTIMIAAAALMLTPAAHAAVSVAKEVASTTISYEQVEGATMEMAAGPGRTGAISAPGGKGSPPGKAMFGANDAAPGKQGETVRIAAVSGLGWSGLLQRQVGPRLKSPGLFRAGYRLALLPRRSELRSAQLTGYAADAIASRLRCECPLPGCCLARNRAFLRFAACFYFCRNSAISLKTLTNISSVRTPVLVL